MENLSEQEIQNQMYNADMSIEARCEWCKRLGKNNICKKFKREVNIKANRFCAYYSPE